MSFIVVIACRVAEHEHSNKMSLHNLAVVFGPTLLRPASKEVQRSPMEQLIFQNNEALMQTAILLYFLNLKERKYEFIRQP
jgi:RhoGAP domain